MRANGLGIIQRGDCLPFERLPAGRLTPVACDSKVGSCPPFTLALEGRCVLMPKEGLAKKGHGSDQIQFMDRVLVPVIMNEERQRGLRWICDTGTNPVALKTCIPWNGTIHGGPRRHGCQGTERTLFKAAPSPASQVRFAFGKGLIAGTACLRPLCMVRRGPHTCTRPSA